MPGYLTAQHTIAIAGVASLRIRTLQDRQQFHDPRGQALALGISSAAWPLFGLPWPSGAQLAALLAQRPVRAGERILETGCGLGLASLVGHRRGADITASDCHPLAASFLRANLRLNGLGPLPYRHGPWAGAGPARGRAGFDLVIGSDLLYERDDDAHLAGFIQAQAAAQCEVWIVDPDRGNRSAFKRRMAQLGFMLQERRLDSAASADAAAYKGRLLSFSRGLDAVA